MGQTKRKKEHSFLNVQTGGIMKKKDSFYTTENIDKTGADYRVIIGQRSNGKSYAVKYRLIKEAWDTGKKFIFLKRWEKQLKIEMIEKYFADMVLDKLGNKRITEITGGECTGICVYRHSIYLTREGEKGKIERIKEIGYVMVLAYAEDYKSLAFPDYEYLLWEEFLTVDGYCAREMALFMSIISTVFRNWKGVAYLVANTEAQLCPAFMEWGVNPKLLKQGTITIYNHETVQKKEDGTTLTVKIAIEYCTKDNKTQAMIFGKSQKMIVGGEWNTKAYPQLEDNYRTYNKHYQLFVMIDVFKFVVNLLSDNNKYVFVYVYPMSEKNEIPKGSRIVTDKIVMDRLVTPTLDISRTAFDSIVNRCIAEKRVFFSDNMCGTTFYQALEMLKNN